MLSTTHGNNDHQVGLRWCRSHSCNKLTPEHLMSVYHGAILCIPLRRGHPTYRGILGPEADRNLQPTHDHAIADTHKLTSQSTFCELVMMRFNSGAFLASAVRRHHPSSPYSQSRIGWTPCNNNPAPTTRSTIWVAAFLDHILAAMDWLQNNILSNNGVLGHVE